FVKKSDPRSALVGEPFARYRYDKTRAAQLFAEGGWTRSADGPLMGADGRQVQIETRGGNQTWAQEVALIADYWRQVGIDAQELVPTPALSRDNEFSSTFPGVVIRARSSGDRMLVAFDSRLQATQQNRWDSLIDRLEATVDVRENGAVLLEVGQLFEADLPALPIYFRTAYAAMRKGVKALTDVASSGMAAT
ncbi:MAG: nikA, partial [Chloroflexi bacterium]|nr:nikA [Chloroflexota bacterium]